MHRHLGIFLKAKLVMLCVILCILLTSSRTNTRLISNSPVIKEPNNFSIAEYVVHDPFTVSLDYLEANCSGDGSEESPYIIENLYIESRQWCIRVYDIDRSTDYDNGTIIVEYIHLTIRNCYFKGIPDVYDNYFQRNGMGVYMNRHTHNVTIQNNIFVDNYYGVYSLFNSTHNKIVNNEFNCSIGVRLDDIADHTVVSNNLFVGSPDDPNPGTYGNGQQGVQISFSVECMIANNTCTGLDHGIQIYLTTNCTAYNNTVVNSFYSGITFLNSSNIMVINNTCQYNQHYGILLDDDSHNNTIANNTLSYNGLGLNTTDYTSTFHEAYDDIGKGFWIASGSRGNSITWNILLFNKNNAIDEVIGNTYDYNIWSDYTGEDEDGDGIGDSPYYVDGGTDAFDPHPRVVSWLPLPTNTNQEINSDLVTTIIVIGGSFATLMVTVIIFKLKKQHT